MGRALLSRFGDTMAVLVTGGAGYIGSHMVWKLLDRGEEVVVLDRLSTGFDWAVPRNAELVTGDISDQALVETTIRRLKVDAIFHFAGSVVVPESVTDPLGYYLNNTVKSRDLIETAIRCGVPHFVFSSTAAVYGDSKLTPVAETEPLAPRSPYGASKWMVETMLRDAAAAHAIKYTILRYFNVAGADPQLRSGQSTRGATHLIKVTAEAATGKRDGIDVFGTDYPTPDGTCIRDYIHVSDLVNAHALALDRLRGGFPSITANCGYGNGYSVLEVIDAVKRIVGRDFKVRMRERRMGDAVTIVADPTIVRRELGWKPLYDNLQTIVSHAVAWEQHLRARNLG